jgi:streptogramin lyase
MTNEFWDAAMRTFEPFAILLMSSLMSVSAVAQSAPPPPLDYVAVADSFSLPTGMTFGSTSGVAINSKGHIFVLHRGPNPLMEFDTNGKFIRSLGEGLFDRPHGLRIDAQDNIWTTDARSHVDYKFSPEGRILLVLGVRDTAGGTPTVICGCSTSRMTWRSDRRATSSSYKGTDVGIQR